MDFTSLFHQVIADSLRVSISLGMQATKDLRETENIVLTFFIQRKSFESHLLLQLELAASRRFDTCNVYKKVVVA